MLFSRKAQTKDIFGRYYKAKFPHYASSVIIPSTAKRRRRVHPVIATRPTAEIVHEAKNWNEDFDTSVQTGSMYDTRSSATSEASKQVAQLIQEELPGCTFDPSLLHEIQVKCEMYLGALKENKIQLNEDAVMHELRLKLRTWAGLMHQFELDDEDVEEDSTTIRHFSRSARSVRSSTSEVDPQSLFFEGAEGRRH